MSRRISRRRAIARLGAATAMLAGASGLAWLGRRAPGRFTAHPETWSPGDLRAADEPSLPPLAVAHGGTAAERTRTAVRAVGGMGRFVKRGETVLVKPNMAWDRLPEQGANTDPEVVAEVVRLCLEAGAARVLVADHPVHDPARVAARSGVASAVVGAGARLVLPKDCGFEWAWIDGAALRRFEVLGVLRQADRLINLPVVKHHALSHLTCGLKNHLGLLGGNRGRLHQEIHTSMVDLAAAFRPTLTVVDATRVMLRNGPTGGRLEDLRDVGLVAAGSDPVACDAWAARLLGLDPWSLPSLTQAEGRRLGRLDAGVGAVLEVAARG